MDEKIEKQKIIDFLRSEMWYPGLNRYTKMEEITVAEHLNIILEDIISKIIKL